MSSMCNNNGDISIFKKLIGKDGYSRNLSVRLPAVDTELPLTFSVDSEMFLILLTFQFHFISSQIRTKLWNKKNGKDVGSA